MALVPLSAQTLFRAGAPFVGARLYAFDAGTSTPRPLYLDAALAPSRQHARPVQPDGDGMLPAMYAGIGAYDIVVQDQAGATVKTIAGLPGDPAPVSGGTDYDPLRQIPTGAMVPHVGTGRRPGYVRANGLTIGSSASDASERNADDTLALYTLLHSLDATVVNGGKTSPAADFAANKTLVLPNFQNRSPIGISDMGGPVAVSLTGAKIDGGTAFKVGFTGGEAAHVLATGELPAHDHQAGFTGTPIADHAHPATAQQVPNHRHDKPDPVTVTATAGSGSAITNLWSGAQAGQTGDGGAHTPAVTIMPAGGHTPAGTVTVQAAGGGSGHNNLAPCLGVMVYLKL